MLKHPETKYRPFSPFRELTVTDRQWPNRRITKPPVWMSTDLRDGNQALFEPMNGERKMRMFKMLVDIGFKEIEVGFRPLRRPISISCASWSKAATFRTT